MNALKLLAVVACLVIVGVARAEKTAKHPGLVQGQPASGHFVKTAQGYMIPTLMKLAWPIGIRRMMMNGEKKPRIFHQPKVVYQQRWQRSGHAYCRAFESAGKRSGPRSLLEGRYR